MEHDGNLEQVVASRSARRLRLFRVFIMGSVIVASVAMTSGAIYQMTMLKKDDGRYPPPGRLIDVGGHRLHVQVMGEGAPTVLLEAGAGGTSQDWSWIQGELAREMTVCAYDRAGLGWSDPGPTPRTGERMVGELHSLLAQVGAQPPYILVGHSFGSLGVRLYAAKYPNEVVGIVLLDPVHEDFFKRMPAEVRQARDGQLKMLSQARALTPFGLPRLFFPPLATRGLPPEVQQAVNARGYRRETYATVREEALGFEATAREVRANPIPIGMNLAVLSRSKSEPWPSKVSADRAEEEWAKMQSDICTLSKDAKHIIVENSGHYIHIDQPEAVIQAIRGLISETRQPG